MIPRTVERLLCAALLAASAAVAETEPFTGTLEADLPDIFNSSLSGCELSTRLQQSWATQAFVAVDAGAYTISVTAASGMPAVGDDALLAIYSPSFTGSWSVNCLAVNDDSNGVLPVSILALQAGQRAVALVTYAWGKSGDGDGATYSATVSGPGEVLLSIFEDGFDSENSCPWSLYVGGGGC